MRPISFFELVSAGSPHDEEIWAKAEGKPVPAATKPAADASDTGRTILFFVDDWHMSVEDITGSRSALANLIDKEMGVRDRAAMFAASGQLGFLQQLTDNKAVLHAALQRLNFQSPGVEDHVWPPMTQGHAILIEQNDQDALNALASDTGGRFLKNTNALDTALITALAEVSRYYLLGWHIDPESVQPGKYRSIQVALKDRPDLKVRLRQGPVDLL